MATLPGSPLVGSSVRERRHHASNSLSLFREDAIVSIKRQTRIFNGTEIDLDAI